MSHNLWLMVWHQSEAWKPGLVLYVTTYKYVRRHNKVSITLVLSCRYILCVTYFNVTIPLLQNINVQIHEFLTLIWPLLLSMTSWHGLYTLPLYLFVIIYSRFQWVALGWFSEYIICLLPNKMMLKMASETKIWKSKRQITTWPQDRKRNYFDISCLYSRFYNYCHLSCWLWNISIPFW